MDDFRGQDLRLLLREGPCARRGCGLACGDDAELRNAHNARIQSPAGPAPPGLFAFLTELMLFPTFLKLGGRTVLLVGGGPVAAGKLRGLLDAGAAVRVVAPDVRQEILDAPVEISRRPFAPSDLDGVSFVVAAAPPDVNRAVATAAHEKGLFVNAVDDIESASAYAGAVFRRAGVTVAISTDGEAPALAGLIREALEVLLPEDLEQWMQVARDSRQHWLAEGVPMAERRPLLLEALNELYRDRVTTGAR